MAYLGSNYISNDVEKIQRRCGEMKRILLCVLALLPLAAHAGKITMSNPDEQELQGGKRLCTYENSIYLFTLVTRSQTCPCSKTFLTENNEK
jgi:hypothetical protein